MLSLAIRLLPALGLLIFPSLAEAHSPDANVAGWTDGFIHPLSGWDHLIVMVAVGLWAAQQRGRAGWAIPLTFIVVMASGGILGASGIYVPGVESMILLSVLIFGGLVLARARIGLGVNLLVVALFAFFHGFAHGHEMPGTAHLAAFGWGFLLATFMLHLTGYAAARLAMMATALGISGAAFAQEAPATTDGSPGPSDRYERTSRIPEITIFGRQDSLIGIASSANQGTVGADQLERRPVQRSGEVLETVPGVIVTQHAGGGKANQYFMRGFNLDHGTDFATSLDGMPINLPSHGHGQGYSDMNIVIPELVERVNYEKGVYYTANGDFSSAGAAHLEFFKVLPKNIAVTEGGMYGYGRGVAASSFGTGPGTILVGMEVFHSGGPWVRPDNYWKENGLITYSQGDITQGFSLTARGYHGIWNSSDQVALSASVSGLIPFFASLDNTTGGRSQRYSMQGEWHRAGADSSSQVMAYGFYYDLDLLSNFTYFLTDPVLGDQFEQVDKRLTSGLQASHTIYNDWHGFQMENAFGFQFRNDNIHNGLFNTQAGRRVNKINNDDGAFIPATARQDQITENSFGFYLNNKTQWTDWFRSEAGMRGDVYTFDVNNVRPQNSGSRAAAIASPKLSLIFGPWSDTEFYLQGGFGYHSNDARGVLTHVDPITGQSTDAAGNAITPASPLVRTYGGEVGIRTLALSALQSTLSVWMLDVNSELLFVGDAGTTEASRPSHRYGVEFANYYTPTSWLTLDADLSLSWAKYRDSASEGNHIPGSIEAVVSAGVSVQNVEGFFGSLRLRYFGPRPLIEDNRVRSSDTILLNGQIGYKISDNWTASADVFNLLGRHDHDIDYFYESRITPTAPPIAQIHFHPVEPRQVRFTLKAFF